MPTRLHHVRYPITRACARGYASTPSSIYPFKKLRALPFVMTPETAQRKMAQYAQLLCGGKYHIRSQIASLLPPEFNFIKFNYKRPASFFTAAYFPAWNISGLFDARIRFPDERWVIRYIPGSDVPTLSAASLWPEDLWNNNNSVPFDEALLKQFDTDVQAIPFNVSPFSFLDVIQTAPDREITFYGGCKVIPSSINVSDFTAMPLLLPLYVATYEDERHGSENILTLFIQAHSNEGLIKADQRQVLEFLSLNNTKAEDVPEEFSLVEGHEVCDFRDFDRRSIGLLHLIVPLGGYDLNFGKTEIEAELMKRFSNTENVQRLARMKTIDNDDDGRIRELSTTEVYARYKWMHEVDQKIDKIYRPNSNEPNPAVSKKDVWAKYAKSRTKKGGRR